MSGIYQAYVVGICMRDASNNSLIRIARSVVRVLSELLEAFLVVLVALLLGSHRCVLNGAGICWAYIRHMCWAYVCVMHP